MQSDISMSHISNRSVATRSVAGSARHKAAEMCGRNGLSRGPRLQGYRDAYQTYRLCKWARFGYQLANEA